MTSGVSLSCSEKETTAVPNLFIDEFMPEANGDAIKIYLYLLRCMSTQDSVQISYMAEKFDLTENKVKRALKHLEKGKLLQLELDEEERLVGICLVDTSVPRKEQKKRSDNVSLRREKKQEDPAPTRTYYSKGEMESFENREEIQDLIFVAEKLMGRSLSEGDLRTILYWYDELSMPTDLIEYLIGHCIDSGGKNISYMNNVALSWKENGILSKKEAVEYVRSRSRIYGKVMKNFGIKGRQLAEKEMDIVDKWKKVYRFSDDLIVEACRRTIERTCSPSFQYADTILSNWREKKIGTMDQVKEEDEVHKTAGQSPSEKPAPRKRPVNKFNNIEQRTYNYAQIEQQFEEQLMRSQQKKVLAEETS